MMNCERIWTEVMQELCSTKELKNKGNLLQDLRIKKKKSGALGFLISDQWDQSSFCYLFSSFG